MLLGKGRWILVCGVMALLALARVAGAEGADVLEASQEQTEKAQTAFRSGDALFDVQRYDDALARYRTSFDLVASPNTRLMIARCLNELGRLDEAHREYLETLKLARRAGEKNPVYQQTAQAAQDELTALRSRLGWLSLELGDVPNDSQLTVAGKPVAVSTLSEPLPVVPGKVQVVATAKDGRKAHATVHLAAGREVSVTLKLGEHVIVGTPLAEREKPTAPAETPAPTRSPTMPPSKRSSLKPYAYVAGAVGVAGLAGFGVLGVLNNKKFSSLESQCSQNHCPPDRASDIDAGRKLQTFANVSLAVGIVGLGASITLFVVGRNRSEPTAVLVGPSSVGLRGRF